MTVPHDPDVMLSAVEQVPVIFMVCEGPDLVVVGFNAATNALMPGRENLGLPLRDVFHELDGQGFLAAYGEAYRTGAPISGQEWRAHIDLPDGSVHEMYANFSITPWRAPDGTLRGVIGVGFDVTAMVRARMAAEAQADELRKRYEQSRDMITALQQELLPAGLPVVPGARLAASYLLAEADTAAGGDWFDAVVQPDGRLALIVGDVVGHGVTASGVMGQLRAVLQDRLGAGAGVAEALAAADRFAARSTAAHATTVCLVVLDPADGSLTYCTAGHPPPLLITADGGTYLPVTGAAPLGVGGAFETRTAALAEGDLLLLYSDGILERPGRGLAESRADLARVAADSAAGRALRDPLASPADRVCTQTVELLVRATGHGDDITLLAVQRVAALPDLELTLPAEPPSLRVSRVEMAAWLARAGATEQDTFAVQHALGELLTNAIEHAFDGVVDGRADVGLRVCLSPDGRIEATVTDQGRWREPARQSMRGRGLALTSQLVDDMRVEPTGTGTVARLWHTLTRPARMLRDGTLAAERPAPVAVAEFAMDEHDGTVRVTGPVDLTNAERLRHELLQYGRGGMLPLTVDLSGVTHLASAGVSALHQVAEKYGQQSAKLLVRAAQGSPAQQVLELVSLPYVTE